MIDGSLEVRAGQNFNSSGYDCVCCDYCFCDASISFSCCHWRGEGPLEETQCSEVAPSFFYRSAAAAAAADGCCFESGSLDGCLPEQTTRFLSQLSATDLVREVIVIAACLIFADFAASRRR